MAGLYHSQSPSCFVWLSDSDSGRNKVRKFLKSSQCTAERRESAGLIDKFNKRTGSACACALECTYLVGKHFTENGVGKMKKMEIKMDSG